MPSLEARRTPLRCMPSHRKVAEILVPVSASTGPDDMETWLLTRIGEMLGADPLRIDLTLSPALYGFDVDRAREVTRELEQCLGRELPENVCGEGCSVRAVARTPGIRTSSRSLRPLPAREEMRSQMLARAARRPRRPSTETGEGLGWDPAGCSPSSPTLARPLDLDLDLALAS